jgi:hypothetical protein
MCARAARYPEKPIQLPAIKWMKDHRNYREEYSDVEARAVLALISWEPFRRRS